MNQGGGGAGEPWPSLFGKLCESAPSKSKSTLLAQSLFCPNSQCKIKPRNIVVITAFYEDDTQSLTFHCLWSDVFIIAHLNFFGTCPSLTWLPHFLDAPKSLFLPL